MSMKDNQTESTTPDNCAVQPQENKEDKTSNKE